MDEANNPIFRLLNLPDVLLYHTICFLATPTNRAIFLSQVLSQCCKQSSYSILKERDALWSFILPEYGAETTSSLSWSASVRQRRMSKRQRRTMRGYVISAHKLLCQRMDAAHFALNEVVYSKQSPLTVGKLRAILKRHGPVLRINHRATIGGTLLVECCRARFVRESVILACVKELCEKFNADPDTATGAGPGVGGAGGLTPLCVVAARGMASVVRYLACSAGASVLIEGHGRFMTYGSKSKSITGSFNPLVWAEAMHNAEVSLGVEELNLKGLDETIRILSTVAARDVGVLPPFPAQPSSSSFSVACDTHSPRRRERVNKTDYYHRDLLPRISLDDTNKVRAYLGLESLGYVHDRT